MLSFLVPFSLAFVLAFVLTPLVIRGAHRAGVLDVPSDARRAHTVPVPRLGGIAVVLAITLLWLGVSIFVGGLWNPFGPQRADLLIGTSLGVGLVFAAGVVDDIHGLSPRTKLMIQIAAALAVVFSGLTPSAIGLVPHGGTWHTGSLIGTGVLVVWIVGVTNAFNLIDGLDGLAGSFALIASGVVLASSAAVDSGLSPVAPTVVGGAVLGFLRFNWNPARVFLGDAGAMTLGFIFAVLSVIGATDANGVTYPILPLIALGYPLTDTLVAILRRWIRGEPLSLGDSRHIHHLLRDLGLSVPQVVTVLTALFTAIAVTSVTLVVVAPQLTDRMIIIGMLLPIIIILWGLRWLQYEEFSELNAAVRSAIRHAGQVVRLKLHLNDAARRIARAETRDEIKHILDALARQIGILDIEIVEPGDRDKATPPSQQITRLDALPVRLDYTFTVDGSAAKRTIVRFWDRPNPRTRPLAIERTAIRIGAAVESWFTDHQIDSRISGSAVREPRKAERAATE
ncbi:MAG: hypothetical protein RLZZ63_295 [Gemmatimonadota bacterium]